MKLTSYPSPTSASVSIEQPGKRKRATPISQLLVMLKRNFILDVRYWRSVLAQCVLVPIIFVLILLALQSFYDVDQSLTLTTPYSYPLDGVQPCYGTKCITIMYAPNTPYANLVMSTFSAQNTGRTGITLFMEPAMTTMDPPSGILGIVPVSDENFIFNYVMANQNTTLFGIQIMDPMPTGSYQIWFNASLTNNNSDIFYGLSSLQRGMDETLLAIDNTPNAASQPNSANPATIANKVVLNYTMKDWPIVPPSVVPDVMIQNFGPMFFFCTFMVIFIACLQLIVTEKEKRLRHAMEAMGLRPSVLWISHFINQAILVFIASIVSIVFALVLRFSLFTGTNFIVLFLMFFLFGISMIMLAFLITTFCAKSRSAVLFGMFFFVVGLLFQSIIFSNSFLAFIWFANVTPSYIYWLFSLLPFFNFGIMYASIGLFTTGKFDALTETSIAGPGFGISDLGSYIPSNLLPFYLSSTPQAVPQPFVFLLLQLANALIFMVLTWYFDKVIPDEYGKRLNPLFLLTKKYWGLGSKKVSSFDTFTARCAPLSALPEFKVENEDELVSNERGIVFDEAHPCAVRIGNLRKEYKNIVSKKNDKVAVKSLCLALEEGSLFVLLGQNGAGKSTTISCLNGLCSPTAGDMLFYDMSVIDNTEELRSKMEICPQHDVLFDDLTAFEHIELYGGLKNLSKKEIKTVAEERLIAVRLSKVRNQRSSTFSGGMKRRLSVVISTLGDPEIIFLDEPTTGMDPVNRRHVWTFLEQFKNGRVIILTTHSMEEADILGDRVAIMSKGKLRALGTGVVLKNRFGEGYRISIIAHAGQVKTARRLVKEVITNAVLEDEAATSLIFRIPVSQKNKVSALIKKFGSPEGVASIDSWGLSQTTLEEVFLKLIRESQ